MILSFVTGPHGVGKSTLCESIASRLNIICLNAGDLIGSHHKTNDSDSKRVENPSLNQKILLSELNKYHSQTVLLTGHLSLLNKMGEISAIDFQIIKMMNPKSIVCVTDSPAEIQTRLMQRDKNKWTLETITNMIAMEESLSKNYATKLGIPWLLEFPNNDSEIINFIKLA